MIRKESRLRVGDNSDAQVVLCIHTNKKKNLIKKSSLGNFIKVTIKRKVNRRDNIRKKVNWCFVGGARRVFAPLEGISSVCEFKGGLIR